MHLPPYALRDALCPRFFAPALGREWLEAVGPASAMQALEVRAIPELKATWLLTTLPVQVVQGPIGLAEEVLVLRLVSLSNRRPALEI